MCAHANQFSLTPQQAELVRELIASGRFENAGDVVSAGLRALEKAEREAARAKVRQMIEHACDQQRRGLAVDGPQAVQEIREKLLCRIADSKG